MSYKLTKEEFNNQLQQLTDEYKIYAPTIKEGEDTFSDTDLLVYDEIKVLSDIEFNSKTKFSPKEIVFPITQTLFYFTEDEYKEPKIDDKDILIFLRPCEVNSFERLDKIFLDNGSEEDIYYKRLREKVKFVVMECTEGFDSCFCVTMDTNETDNYSLFLRKEADHILCEVKDDALNNIFMEQERVGFTPQFIQKNKQEVKMPKLEKINQDIFTSEIWKEYSGRCIACGRCNTVCPTCSCWTMQDIIYRDNENAGERRRVWVGCHIDGYTEMAGGHRFREEYGDRMRFKTLHKIYDFRKRFGINMCVGCGRCEEVCPKYISFLEAIKKLNQAIEEGV
ncbi:anaerobic sulfite reductase subunit AsrA [Selenihalanaerobacter shriftii]|uniref:Anaerobic sulfite reductase subunit A n=1 Tax=Selenihalanaerobacter shriftii TaxID=142842 RepID=A0A1T4LQ63_9FIRM|nr:anaerobic sulfite reductase subunit AsrA [Selenihalanaerobacter shriftii]SJZ56776.1 anaerobic sulfite reductase subunit A [Selenihalanaerobacter shriftii]